MTKQVDDPETIARARAALQRQDWRGAVELFDAVVDPSLPIDVLLDQALALRMSGDLSQAVAVLDQILVLDPRHFLTLLSKGALLERLGKIKSAAVVYNNALATAPPDDALPNSLVAPVKRARDAVRAHAEALADVLRSSVADLRDRHPDEALGRFNESLEMYSGLAHPYPQQPLVFHYPRLPAIPFYDRDLFPWLAELEAATPTLQAELTQVRNIRPTDFKPYVVFPPGVPVNQWRALNHSRDWSTFFLWRDGVRQDDACARCPATASLLQSLPIADQPGFAPTAMFSVLDGRKHIPPHTGAANTRLIVHLPLVLPGPARFRVGAETRDWRMGEAWVFDDTIEHEAWNDADAPRTILIFDIWNPLLSEAERALVSAMMTAKNAYMAND